MSARRRGDHRHEVVDGTTTTTTLLDGIVKDDGNENDLDLNEMLKTPSSSSSSKLLQQQSRRRRSVTSTDGSRSNNHSHSRNHRTTNHSKRFNVFDDTEDDIPKTPATPIPIQTPPTATRAPATHTTTPPSTTEGTYRNDTELEYWKREYRLLKQAHVLQQERMQRLQDENQELYDAVRMMQATLVVDKEYNYSYCYDNKRGRNTTTTSSSSPGVQFVSELVQVLMDNDDDDDFGKNVAAQGTLLADIINRSQTQSEQR